MVVMMKVVENCTVVHLATKVLLECYIGVPDAPYVVHSVMKEVD